jgi:hypothetical protein
MGAADYPRVWVRSLRQRFGRTLSTMGVLRIESLCDVAFVGSNKSQQP